MHINYEQPLGFPPFTPKFAFNIIRRSTYRSKGRWDGGRVFQRCFPSVRGFEHVADYLVTGIGFLEIPLDEGLMGLALMFPSEHGCFAMNDGKTASWGRWTRNGLLVGEGKYFLNPDGLLEISDTISVGPNGVECDTTTPSPYYTSPRRLPAKLVSGEDPIRQTTSRLPQGHVAFGVFRGDENLEPFRPYMARIGAYLRPGVRYALTPATEKGKGLMLQFWGMHGCFVPALGGVQWGKWLESENALHCRPSSYISAVDGKEYYGLSRFDARLGRYIGDLFFDKDFYRKPLPQEGEAPELRHAMRADRLHEMAI